MALQGYKQHDLADFIFSNGLSPVCGAYILQNILYRAALTPDVLG